jgi:hypothetical protein
MSEYGGDSELGSIDLGGDRALDDLLSGENGVRDEGIPGWVRDVEASSVGEEYGGEEEEVSEAVLSASLAELAHRFQVAFRGKVYSTTTRGRVPVSGTTRGDMVNEKLFHCPNTVYMSSVDDPGIYGQLKSGRVVANVVAATGSGKTTKFPAKVAVNCCMRVLFVTPNAVFKSMASEMLSKILTPTRLWVEEKVPALVVLTPMEVLGRFMGSGWYDLNKHFDCIIVDESHLPLASMYALRSVLVTKDIGSVSLLFLTATTGQADVQKTPEPEYVDMSIEDALEAADFESGPYAVDRTAIIVESDDRVRRIAKILTGYGLEVYTLESSINEVVMKSVFSALSAATASMRFVVMHETWGTSTNLPIARVLTTGTTSILVNDNDHWFYGPSLLSKVEIDQQMGRANRGLTDSARAGVVFVAKHMIPEYRSLRPSEYFDAYVLLVAMNINPRGVIRDAVKAELPFGLTPRVAAGLLSLPCVPCRMSIRFLDGTARFPYDLVKAGRHFAAIGGINPIGSDAKPLGFDCWPEYTIKDVLGLPDNRKVKLPVRAKGELLVHLTLLCGAAQGLYQPSKVFEIEMSGYESGPDYGVRPGKFQRSSITLPPLYTRELVKQEELPPVVDNGFSFEVPLADQPVYNRRFGAMVPGVVRDHLAAADYVVSVPDVSYGENSDGKRFVKLDFSASAVALHSPGGSVAFKVGDDVWKTMVSGDPLSLDMFKRLMARVGKRVTEFAMCDAFAYWGEPWCSILRSVCDREILFFVKSKNYVGWLTTFLAALWKRYTMGMEKACNESHQIAGFWRDLVDRFREGMISKYSVGSGARIPQVAQSNQFYSRVYEIRKLFADAILVMESESMFDPARVADLQRVLPITRSLGNRLFDGIRRGHVRVMSDINREKLLQRFERRDRSGSL